MSDLNDDFHRKLLSELATASLREKRAQRRWGVFFRALFFAYLITVTVLYYQGTRGSSSALAIGDKQYAAIIQISGTITSDGSNSAAVINNLLRNAFADSNSKGIILEINSPGGSAVESNRIYNEIRRLREKYPDKQVIAVAGDLCASGGYFIAAAADSIYADPASIIGSIGVVFSSFGFVDAMDKLGIERRVQTAGSNKNLLDPFSPQEEEGKRIMEEILDDIHLLFRQAVLDGRGERLAADGRIFTGSVFSGSDSKALGLIDGFNDTGGVARDIIGVEDVRYYAEQDWLGSLLDRFGGLPSGGVQALMGG